jgi:hypothetical protein
MAILKDAVAVEPKSSFTFNPSNPSASGYGMDFDDNNRRPRRAPAMHSQLKLDEIIDLEKLCKSPRNLIRRLSYLSSIVFDDGLKKTLRQRVLSHLLQLENSAENISLLEAAKACSFFSIHPSGFVGFFSDIGRALSSPIETEDQKALGLRITAFKQPARVGGHSRGKQ